MPRHCPTLSKVGLFARATALWRAVRRPVRVPSGASEAGPPVRSQLPSAAFTLTAAQVERLIAGAASHRDRTLIRLLAETGMRRSEAAALSWQDIDSENRMIVIRNGKGGKLRLVPMTAELTSAISTMDRRRDVPHVFLSRQGRPLSVRQVNRIVADAGRRAGISHPNPTRRQLTCHLLRHTFARLWKAEGGSIETLSTIMGHASLRTTWDVYGREGLADVRHNYERTLRQIFRQTKKREGN